VHMNLSAKKSLAREERATIQPNFCRSLASITLILMAYLGLADEIAVQLLFFTVTFPTPFLQSFCLVETVLRLV
jgi:hypothetical protein